MEQSRREWARERADLLAVRGESEARMRDLADQLALVQAALPPDHKHHHMDDDGQSLHDELKRNLKTRSLGLSSHVLWIYLWLRDQFRFVPRISHHLLH